MASSAVSRQHKQVIKKRRAIVVIPRLVMMVDDGEEEGATGTAPEGLRLGSCAVDGQRAAGFLLVYRKKMVE